MPTSPFSSLLAATCNLGISMFLIFLFHLWGVPVNHIAVSIAVWCFFASAGLLLAFFAVALIALCAHTLTSTSPKPAI